MKTIKSGKITNAILKVCVFFLTVGFTTKMQATTPGEVRVSIEANQKSLKWIFGELEAQTQYTFNYANEVLKDKRSYSLAHKDAKLEEVLNSLSMKAGLQFKISDRSISVKKSKADEMIYGQVNDSEGNPIPGVNVLIKGTATGTTTDFDGKFSIEAEPGDVLVISYVGFKTQEVTVDELTLLTIVLEENVDALKEVVVYGYGSSTKEKFNGAVSKVENTVLNRYSSANFEQAISGNIAGVQVIENGKNPGENSTIQIRGINSLTAGTEPLIVVDGIPLTEGSSFSSISNQDIESINILKDAASAAIYGSRASNGVILITTRKGKQGKLKVTYDTYYGFQDRIDRFEQTDAYDAAIFHLDARNNGYVSGGPGRSIDDDNATRDANGGGKRSRIPDYLQAYLNREPGLTNTDWEDVAFRQAAQSNHYLNLSGGLDRTNYSVSFGYMDQENIVVASDYERFTNNINLNSEVNDWLRFGISSNASLSNANLTGERAWSDYRQTRGNQPDTGFGFYLMDPYYPVRNPDGSLAISVQLDDHNENWDGPISENILVHALLTDYTERLFRIFGNTYVEIEPVKNLTFKTVFGGDYRTGLQEFFAPDNIGRYRTPIANNPAVGFEERTRSENYITENFLNYSNLFGDHNLDVLLGYSYQQETFFRTRIEGTDFVDNNIRNIAGAASFAIDVDRSKWSLESYFSRVQYDYKSKYFVSASYRRDGSSRFGSNSRYADFASVSGGWTVSNEDFWPENEVFNFLKLRASWGQTGNNQIGDFASLSLISSDTNYTIDGQLIAGSSISTSPNSDLTWETNTALNLGADFGFLNNRLVVTAEYYNSKTEDLLLNVPVPQQSGFSTSLQNIGELENRGFELEISGRDFNIGNLGIGFNANITTNENEVLALGEGQEQIIFGNGGVDFLTEVGGSIAEFYAYDIEGVFKTQAEVDAANNGGIVPLAGTEVGDYIVRDANGDGRITPDDRVKLGDYNPEFTYGFGINLTYKGFDFNAQFQGIEGRKLYDAILRNAEAGEGFATPSQYYFDNYYHPTRNPDGFLRSPDFSSFSSAGRATRASNLSVFDGDYFRLRSLQVGYSISQKTLEPIGLDALRVYFTGNNIFNLTNYRGLSSEGLDDRSDRNRTLSRGLVRTGNPLTRFLALGLNVKF